MHFQRREFILLLGGAAATWPLTALAQPAGTRRVGVLLAFDENDSRPQAWLAAFTQGLAELGWTTGRNLQTDIRWAGNDVDLMRKFAKELVASKPNVILAFGTPVTAALQRETRTIPIVFAIVSDPVGDGFVASLAHPGGNITGFHNSEASIAGKWFELLAQIAPGLKRVAMIFNPDTAPGHGKYYMPDFEAAALSSQVIPVSAAVHTVTDLEAVIADLGSQPGGGFVAMADFFLLNNRAVMIAAAAQDRVPAIYPWQEVTAAGGLLSYGPDLEDIVRSTAPYVNRILHGENPADLPVQVPTKFQLVVNLKTAKALGLTISRDFLLVADEVIE
jgi:putative tryptophan/tyrosine transport system substrate-binding protein